MQSVKSFTDYVDIKHFIIGGIVALVIVTGGYFVAEIPLMGYETALVSLISSPIQWCMSMVASAIIVPILIKNRKRIGFNQRYDKLSGTCKI